MINIHKKYKFYVGLLLIPILSVGCSTEKRETLIGTWAVDDFEIAIDNNKNESVIMLGNLLSFEKNGDCKLPVIYSIDNKYGRWILKGNTLTIEAENHLVGGTYDIEFVKDYETRLLKLKLRSKYATLYCTKMLHQFDNNAKVNIKKSPSLM